ncbi:MAG: class I SAM-dependent methyltransferase [SAR202 cluster bacterium]|nr:class I SAM-dependent methyltransferase [SAR202 cluster bacterium]
MTTIKKVDKNDVRDFWENKVPFFETERSLKDIDLSYLELTDKTHLLYSPFLNTIRKDLSKKGKTIIEVGCGGGMDSRAFAKLGLDVITLDLNRRSCEVTKKGYHLLNLQMNVIQADAENLPFRSNCVDIVYSFGTLHHTPDTQKAVHEIYRIVKHSVFVMLYNKNLSYYAKKIRHNQKTKQEIFNMYDNTVLSKLYNKSEIRQMFDCFKNINIQSRMFLAAKYSPKKVLHLLLFILHFTGLERLYGSVNLIWAEKAEN